MADYTPMMKQYFEIKKQHENCILFFRLGDFYEMFFDDAKLVSQELELTLTGRDCGQEERAPMCGVPFHSYESYVARLVSKGYKVAICEQTEDPAKAQGLVKRDVIRIITPGTVIEGSMLDEAKNNYLAAVWLSQDAKEAGLAFVDCSTGDIQTTALLNEDVTLRVTNEMARFAPSEVLLNTHAAADPLLRAFFENRLHVTPDVVEDAHFDTGICEQRLLEHFQSSSLEELELSDRPAAVRALGCAMQYLYSTQMNGLSRLSNVTVYSDVQFMRLDLTARRNLELLETMRNKEKRGSLLGVLDRTKTAMGKRLIRSWIEQPLVKPAQITRRLSAVQELLDDPMLRGDLTSQLTEIYDLERIMTRIVYGSANAKELRSLWHTIGRLAPLKERLKDCQSLLLQDIYRSIDPLLDIYDLLDRAIVEDPPFTVREGGMIREGYHEEIDALNRDMKDGKGVISRVEADEKEKTGIKNLKVGYNRVFGYYIELSRAYSGEVPEGYIRKQTLANAERYITQELKELEARILGAHDRVVALEYQVFTEVRNQVAGELHRIQRSANAVASLDVLCSFAEVAFRQHYCRPEVDMRGNVHIKN
ncbi:MAG: DNA mismatch repair protein MutS, partial [Clostridia bacterium]|nr:DNA mismatch repair protein MutS [Clostridia bacterium]